MSSKKLLVSCLLIASACSYVWAQVVPELPRVYLDTAYSPPTGNTIVVNAGGNLQTAVNNAVCGDIISLQAGAAFTGNFNLPNKACTGWIYIQSSAYSQLPAPGNRVSPAQANLMPKIVTPNTSSVLATGAGAHHYRFVGVEITGTHSTTASTLYALVSLEAAGGQSSLSQVPTDIVFDRCYIHGTPTGNVRRGISLQSARTAVVDSYLSDFHEVGADSQAIATWNGPGPFRIVNNYLAGSGENVIFGGADPSIANLVPSDVEIRNNHFHKPLSWRAGDPSYAGIHWSIKNLFELKNARRLLIEGNVFEYSWADAQIGWALVLKASNSNDTAPWSVTEDVTIRNNIIRHAAHGIAMAKNNGIYPSLPMAKIAILNNLWDDIGSPWSPSQPGRLFGIFGVDDVSIDHNTAFHDGSIIVADVDPSQRLIFRNNMAPHNAYGVIGTGTGTGNDTLNKRFPGATFTKNVIWGAPQYAYLYPAGNFFPNTVNDVGFVNYNGGDYHLSAASPYKNAGTDGKDLGADIDAVNAATACAVSGICGSSLPPPSDAAPPAKPRGLRGN